MVFAITGSGRLFAEVPDVSVREPITPAFYNGRILLADLVNTVAAGGAAYTISTPGRYYVVEDLQFNPDNHRVSAIYINSNNVFLNLNSASIYQKSTNTNTGLMGVEIAGSVKNVRVANGTIAGLTVSDATEQNAGLYIGANTQTVTIENVTVSNCTSVTREVIGFLANSGSTGLRFINCESVNNTNTATVGSANDPNGYCNGFKINTCLGAVLEKCNANRNSSTNGVCFGIRLESCKYTHVLQCTALYNVSSSSTSTDYVAGLYTYNSRGDVFKNCTSNGNYAGSNAGCMGIGCYVNGTSRYVMIKDSCFEANYGGTGDGYGIQLAATQAFCLIDGNRVAGNTGANTGYGIKDGGTNVTNVYVRNFAMGNAKDDGSTAPVTTSSNFVIDPKGAGAFPTQEGSVDDYTGLTLGIKGFKNTSMID